MGFTLCQRCVYMFYLPDLSWLYCAKPCNLRILQLLGLPQHLDFESSTVMSTVCRSLLKLSQLVKGGVGCSWLMLLWLQLCDTCISNACWKNDSEYSFPKILIQLWVILSAVACRMPCSDFHSSLFRQCLFLVLPSPWCLGERKHFCMIPIGEVPC